MKINEGIKELWKSGFFETHRSPKEVESALFDEYKLTVSNISAHLACCTSFLRKQARGWVQRQGHLPVKSSETGDDTFFESMKIHPEIRNVSAKLYVDGHYAESVFAAFKKLNNLVKKKSREERDGPSLMRHVFSPDRPVLMFNDLTSRSDKDEQEGFMHIFAGVMSGIRNPKGHEDIVLTDPQRAREYLILASLLCKRLDETKRNEAI